ncbi:MAG: hypothetical protein A2X23_07535 [Chloroflexi bacterium GWC2_73_18]|nr:MAG: hypothetical protein A2X23_07535 [Chloroflexi bacterium GWC2_73_18]
MSVGTPFHPRTAPLNSGMVWREWAGYYAAGVYADSHDIEYNAIREAAALIDVSPLFKYEVRGPDATRLVDRVITRDATRIEVGGVVYTPWCDEDGFVIDDGTVARLDETAYRWTAADPTLRWLRMNARGLDVSIEDVSESVGALALQGPFARDVLEAATSESFADLRYFRRRAAKVGKIPIDVTRTGYTGDLGYELWVAAEQAVKLWDALVAAGRAFGLMACGILALDVARIEAGLVMIEVDYTSVRHAIIPAQKYTPFEIGLGRLVSLDKAPFNGARALRTEAIRGPKRQLVGLEVDWDAFESMHLAVGLSPIVAATASRQHVPVYAAGSGAQVGRATSSCWSPILKRTIALGSVASGYAEPGTRLKIEATVEAARHRVDAKVVPLPFLDLPRKRA